jgi:hypothetical protein
VEGVPPSAVVLLRGPPGSGKSVFGTQLAGCLARARACDVAYGCVELLPTELREQHAAFERPGEQIVVPPFVPQAHEEKQRRMFAALLELGDTGAEDARGRFGAAVIQLLEAVERAGGKPGVLVIDSLSDGYGLGASVPRVLADQLGKLAVERGMILILQEEALDDRPSPWSFASEVVLGLDLPQHGGAERLLTVLKNRFGHSAWGPHELAILPRIGVRIDPHPATYLTAWGEAALAELAEPAQPLQQSWGIPPGSSQALPPFRDCVTAVYGPDPALVRRTAERVGLLEMIPGTVDLRIDFNRGRPLPADEYIIGFEPADPFMLGNRLIASAFHAVLEQRGHQRRIRRLLVGDLRSIRTYSDANEVRRALLVLTRTLQRLRVPVVLFETTAGRTLAASVVEHDYGHVTQEPPIADAADVLIEVVRGRTKSVALVSDLRGGHEYTWELGDNPLG